MARLIQIWPRFTVKIRQEGLSRPEEISATRALPKVPFVRLYPLAAKLDRAIGWAVSVLVFVILVSIVAQAINRYFNLVEFNAFDQVARLAMVWAVMLALVQVFARRTNVRVDLLDAFIGDRMAHLRNILADAAGATLMGLIHYKSWALISIGTTLRITGTPFNAAHTYSAVSMGTFLLFFLFTYRVVTGISVLIANEKDTSPGGEGDQR